jgi:hypothetical protein
MSDAQAGCDLLSDYLWFSKTHHENTGTERQD